MTFFFLLRPDTISWLPAPIEQAENAVYKKKKRQEALAALREKDKQNRRRELQAQDEELLIMLDAQ